MPIAWLDSGGARPPGVEAARVVARPHPGAEAGSLERLAAELRRALAACRAQRPRPAGSPAELGPEALARLRRVSARLRDPASRGEVLSLVMRFAAESFERVALFMLRDDRAVGIAQVGLARAGGPDDAALRRIEVPCREPAWFRAVLDSRQPVRSAAADAGDERLARKLGNALPSQAYVAPLESGERVVALLYADNLPGGRPLAESTDLEVVLHEAGLALDRALLERALAEAEAGQPPLGAASSEPRRGSPSAGHASRTPLREPM